MGRKTHGPFLVEAIESNNLRQTSSILTKFFNDRSKLQRVLWAPVPRPLFESVAEVPMLLASSLPDPTILNYLVTSCGADVNRVFTSGHPKKQKQSTCLITAVRKSAYGVVSYLLNIGCDANRADHKNRTPLHHAVRRADFAMTKLLLSKGAMHDRIDMAGNTPLHVATLYGHTQLVRLLAKSGADLYKQGHFGALPLHMAAKEGHAHLVSLFCCTFEVNPSLKVPCYDGIDKSPLHLAAMRGHFETVKLLVEDCGALVDSKDPTGNTALHYCFSSFYDPLLESRSKDDHAETSRILLEMGADPNIRNAEGEMPLHLASKNGYEKGIEVLLMMGASCGDEARNSAGNRPVDLLSDKSGVSASILKTAARDPQGFLNETIEVLSRRGANGSTNVSFNGSNTGVVAKFSSKFSEQGTTRLNGKCAASPRLPNNRLASRAASIPGLLGNSHQPSMESINRMNQFSKQTSQIEKSLRECIYDEDGYLTPQEIPFIDDQMIEQLYKERIKKSIASPTRSSCRPSEEVRKSELSPTYNNDIIHDPRENGEHLTIRSPSKERCRKKTPVPSKKTISENGSSSLWEVTPNTSVISTAGSKEHRQNRKIINGICNLSNVFEENSNAGSDNNRRGIERSIDQALKRVSRRRDEEHDNISDYDDSFSTVSEGEEETLKRHRNGRVTNPKSPNIKHQFTHQTNNQKRIRSSGSVSSSFESESSGSTSASVGQRRALPPIPGDQSPFEMEEVVSCKKLFNVEVDSNQLAEWTIMKFNPVFPSRPSTTFLVRTSVARQVIKSLDNEKFLNRLSKNNFNLPNCSTESLHMSEEDFLDHEYENTTPGPNTVKYIVKLCVADDIFEWSKEIIKPPTLPKKNAMEKIGNKPVHQDDAAGRKQIISKKHQIPSSCSETDSFTSGTSSSSNELNSFIPKEARKKLSEQQKHNTTDNYSGVIKKGFGLQKDTCSANASKSWRTQKTNSRVEIELDKSPKSKRLPLAASPVRINSASAEDILNRVDQTARRRGTSREELGSTYLNCDSAQELSSMKGQQNVLNWVSANQESTKMCDDESSTYKRNRSFKSVSKSSAFLQRPSIDSHAPAVYEQLDDDIESRNTGTVDRRIILFENSDNLGFSISGGNVYGIFVKDIHSGCEAQTAGLRIRDEIVEVNGKSLEGRSREEAYKMLERCRGRIELKIKRNQERRFSYENGDKFFVQACFDFVHNLKTDKHDEHISQVKQGDIFCVIDSMPENKGDCWKAIKAESNNNEHIYIPNKSKAIGIMAKYFVESNTVDKKSRGQAIFRSFRKPKSTDDEVKYSGINNEFLKPYKNVILVPPQVKRPVFIAGLFSEAVCRRLIADSPGLFEIPDKIVEVSRFMPDIPLHQNGSMQRSMSNSSLSPIDVEPLKSISARGKHALCCLSPKAIELVRQQSDLNPIAIYLSCPNKQVVKDVAATLTATNVDVRKNNVVNSMFDNSIRFEKYYGNLFDAILSFRSDSSWFSILKDTIAKMQVIPKWRTVELLDEDEGSLVREKHQEQIIDSEVRHSKTTDDLPESSKKQILEESLSRSKHPRKRLTSKLFSMKSAQSMSEL